ncbi:MAG TPA: hypothetical protein DGF30_11630 [Desulfomicrobium sp.]|nr:hypothetical protein [Desulfomicrobium sp.]
MRKEIVIEGVRQRIKQFAVGEVFGYDAFGELAQAKRKALTRALSQLVKAGEIKKASRGRFYKPAKNRFGDVPITDAERLKDVLKNGYVSGTAAFNRLGITTQIPAVIEIASPDKSYSTNVGRLRIQYTRSYIREIPKDVELLMILDAIKEIRKVPDASPDDVVRRLLWIIKRLEKDRVEKMVEYAMHYPPRVRAILGAILEHARYKRLRSVLKATLNPDTEYLVGLEDSLPNLKKWKLLGPGRTYRAWKRRWEKRKMKCSTDT